MPLSFLSAIYNSEITFKKTDFLQKDFNDKIEVASEVDKGNSERKPEESIAKRVRLGRRYSAKIKREEESINNKLLKEYFTIYQSPIGIYKTLCKTEGI